LDFWIFGFLDFGLWILDFGFWIFGLWFLGLSTRRRNIFPWYFFRTPVNNISWVDNISWPYRPPYKGLIAAVQAAV
jgi:hypothetical protein